jgi:hypothetical protein
MDLPDVSGILNIIDILYYTLIEAVREFGTVD